MKKTILLALLTFITGNVFAQEKNDLIPEKKLSLIIKPKLGFSELQIDNYNNFNGYISAFEIMLSSKLSNKFNLEYGLGLSEFKATNFYENQLVNIKNNYYHLPVNLMYNKNVNPNSSLIIGFGFYGSYLAKSDLGGKFKGNNVGVNFGCNLQAGVNLQLSDAMGFRIMFEGLTDLSKIEKNLYELKHTNTNLLSLSFIHKL